jgi:hypothetical protein
MVEAKVDSDLPLATGDERKLSDGETIDFRTERPDMNSS